MTAQSYAEKLQTLSEGSARVSFNAFRDVPWDDPAYAIDLNDPRWVLPSVDPLGGTDWYQSQPLERQIEIGVARMANVLRVGWQFENALIKGILEYLMDLPGGRPEFRYLMHEVTEETHHIQMFEEFVRRTGIDAPGAPGWFKSAQRLFPFAARRFPYIFFVGVLGGEEPIDHVQKSILRSGEEVHPLLHRIMQIHIAEEARHISFGHEYVRHHAASLGTVDRAVVSVLYPVIMRLLCDVIMRPSNEFIKQYDVPRSVIKELFWEAPESRKLLRDVMADVRALAEESGLMNPVSRRVWRLLGIAGRPARYRSEPAPKAA